MADYQGIVENIGIVIDGVGVAVIMAGGLLVTGLFAQRLLAGEEREAAYRQYRRGLGRAILLGLEFLVAGDIIRTVAVEPTFQSLGIVAGLVAIRTVLSFTLEVEITGAWPWQHHGPAEARAGNRAT